MDWNYPISKNNYKLIAKQKAGTKHLFPLFVWLYNEINTDNVQAYKALQL